MALPATTSGPMSYQDREKRIKQQFLEARSLAAAHGQETGRQVRQELDRRRAITGGAAGALAKLGTQAERQIGQDVGQAYSQLEMGKTQALEGLATEEQQIAQMEKDRLLKERALETQEKTLFGYKDPNTGQWVGGTMQFQWAELDVNKQTNFINSLTALKDAGFFDAKLDEVENFWASGLDQLFPGFSERLPRRARKQDAARVGPYNYQG